MALTDGEAAQLAARKLGASKVVADDLRDWRDEGLLCFVADCNWSLPEMMESLSRYIGDYFCFVDTATSVAVSYDLRSDWETDSGTAWLNFAVGLHSQFYCLELFDVRDWNKTRQLLQAMRLHAKTLVPRQENHRQPTDWLTMNVAPLKEALEQNGKLIFQADINGYYLPLYAGRHYNCFDYALFTFNRATQTRGAKIFPHDEMCQEELVSWEEEEFWERLDSRPVENAKGF